MPEVQKNLWGEEQAPASNLFERARYILRHYPETRGDDERFLILWWRLSGNLDSFLTRDQQEKLVKLMKRKGMDPETVYRRRREVQKTMSEDGEFRPNEKTVEARRKKSRQGPVH